MCSPFFPTFSLTLPNSFLGMGGKCIAFANGWIVIYAFYLSLEFGCTFFVWNQHLNYLQCTSNRLNFQHTSSSPLAIFIPWWDQNDVWNISHCNPPIFFCFQIGFCLTFTEIKCTKWVSTQLHSSFTWIKLCKWKQCPNLLFSSFFLHVFSFTVWLICLRSISSIKCPIKLLMCNQLLI